MILHFNGHMTVIVVLVLIPAMNFQSLLEFVGTRAIPAGVLFVGVSFGVGYFLGGPTRETRQVLGFGTAWPRKVASGGFHSDIGPSFELASRHRSTTS